MVRRTSVDKGPLLRRTPSSWSLCCISAMSGHSASVDPNGLSSRCGDTDGGTGPAKVKPRKFVEALCQTAACQHQTSERALRARFVARTETTRRLRSLHPLCGKSRPHPIQLEAPASHRHTRRLWRLLRWLRVDAVRQLVGGHAGPVVRSSSTALDGQIYWGVEAKQWEPAPPWRAVAISQRCHRYLAALPLAAPAADGDVRQNPH